MQDQHITCIGASRETPCPTGATFIHSVKDQEFFAERGFSAPKRCKDCVQAKKQLLEQGGGETRSHGDRGKRGAYQKTRRPSRDEPEVGDSW